MMRPCQFIAVDLCLQPTFTLIIYNRVISAIIKHIEVGLVHTHVLIMARILLCV